MEKKKIHYAWIILFGVCLGQAASLGLSTANNIFYLPLMEALNVDRSAVTMTATFVSVGQLVTLPFVPRVYDKVNAKLIMIPLCIAYACCPLLMSFGNDIKLWYVLSVIQGMTSAFAFTGVAPLMLSNWFKTKFGVAMGISSAVGSLFGVIMNPVGSLILETYGWRFTYRVVASLIALLSVPAAVFIYHYRPSDIGMLPYGAEEIEGQSAKEAGITPSHFTKRNITLATALFFIVSCICSWVPGYFSHLPAFAVSIGLTATIGSLMVSFEIAGTTVSKLLVGPMIEKIGHAKTSLFVTTISTIGFILYFVNFDMKFGLVAFYICSFMCGMFMSTVSIITPVFTRDTLGSERYLKVQPFISIATTVLYSFAQTAYAGVIDSSLGFKGLFAVALILSLISCVMINGIKIFENKNLKEIEAGAPRA